jgi:hypothetical protein
MTRPPRRCERPASLLLGLLLAGAVLTGCHPGQAGEQPVRPTQPTRPAQAAPPPPSAPPTPLHGCGQPFSGVGHDAEGPRARRFEVTQQQLAVIGSRLFEVFCHQGLWQQDVGFGVHYSEDRTRILVLINPGHSGLTARQVLDRLLGRR